MEKFHQINVENLLFKIEKFYKRFYINKLIKGIIFFVSIILGFFLVFDAIFYYGDLSDLLRFIVFYSFILLILSGIYYWILDPMFRLFKINKGLSLEEASRYIGGYYSEIGDKLLNAVQFYNQDNNDVLTLAALDQSAGKLKGFDFVAAAPPVTSNRNIFYLLIPISFFIGVLVFNSKVITEGSNRLINYEVNYARIAPFEFDVIEFKDRVIVGSEVEIVLELRGNSIPNDVNVNLNGNIFRMNNVSGNRYNFILEDVHEETELYFIAGKYKSRNYTIEVLKDVMVTGISAEIMYPDYTKLSSRIIDQPSLLNVPYGSKIIWNLELNNSNSAYVDFDGDRNELIVDTDFKTKFEKEVSANFQYDVVLNNLLDRYEIGFSGEVNVIEDQYPSITVSETNEKGFYIYTGRIEDDYGFKDLKVKMAVGDSLFEENIAINNSNQMDVFSYKLDIEKFTKSVKVVFEVRDNDMIHGFKSRESDFFNVVVLNEVEKRKELDEERDELVKDLEDLVKEKDKLDLEIDDLKKDLLDKKQLDWDSKKGLDDLLKKNEEHKEKLENISERLEKHNQSVNKNSQELDDEIIQKQKQLNDLFNKVMDEESKKLLEELQQLLNELDKKKIQDHLDKMQMNNEKLKDELDMNLEIFKQMEFEQEFNEVLNELEKLADEQLDLAEKSDMLNKDDDGAEVLDKQDSLNKEFEKLMEDMDKLDSLNNELDDPNKLEIDSNALNDIKEDQENATEELKDKDFEKSSEDQKKAGEQMKKMAESMQMMMQMEMQSQQGEDLESLRKILENLLVLSFEQEELMMELRAVDKNDPRVVGINQDQKNLIENSDLVKDSLMALATRVYQLNDVITEDVGNISREMDKSVMELQERRFPETLMHQQKSLTSINNLAVLLDEIIQQMQEQQNQQNQSNGSCSKPGQGKPKPSMKKSKMSQKDLAKRMEQLKKELEKGKKPGKKNPGQMGMGMSKEIAEMAAQQEMIRREIQKMAEELKKEGNLNGAGELKKLEELLEKNEEDLINFELDNEFFMRQKEIEIRMLEAENAKRKRDLDNKRESEESDDLNYNSEEELERYQLEKQYELELLRIFNPGLTNYYKNQVQKYNGEMK